MAADPFVGKTFGKCRLKKKIGKGAIGIVYRARHLTLNIDVAVKLLKPQTSFFNSSTTQRFQREAKTAGCLEHRNVLKIFDIGQEEDIHYIVMEYVDGKSVDDYLAKQGALPIKTSIKIIKQAAEGLAAAHAANILHRDVKPANILISRKDEVVKLADFGLARLNSQNNIKLTDTGSIVGTMGYTAPEQMKGNPTVFSDLYSLGITLFEMLTGKLPYQGESAYAVINKHAKAPIPSVRSIRSEVPQALDDFVQQLMAKNPQDRPQSANYVATFLDTFLQKLRKGIVEKKPVSTRRNRRQIDTLKTSTERMPMVQKRDRSAYNTKVRVASQKTVVTTPQKTLTSPQVTTAAAVSSTEEIDSISGTFEYQLPVKTVDQLWLIIITIFFIITAILTSSLALVIFFNKVNG
ncbi:serine/threonine-protein kinase [Candidatus Uabimicrobium amorphum]|uniref:non-specific serine/threonine protein kinase n=1 Tax=Uabimicrobium amorphum TaxID=2596890 RepID=A0A5S9IMX2_UABAM|nr:serine/threonine-protein kinase [Candidatus Uabimicrobium amorphum]BBM83505.1 serine/threonine protein kinase [Candidatus Uabimicrobium amorphum]